MGCVSGSITLVRVIVSRLFADKGKKYDAAIDFYSEALGKSITASDHEIGWSY